MAERSIQIVLSNPYPGKDDEFNEWYDNTHAPEVLAMPGVLSCQRYDLRQLQRDKDAGKEPAYRYLAIYEMEGDVDEILASISAAVRAGKIAMSDSFDARGSNLSFWLPRGEKQVAK